MFRFFERILILTAAVVLSSLLVSCTHDKPGTGTQEVTGQEYARPTPAQNASDNTTDKPGTNEGELTPTPTGTKDGDGEPVITLMDNGGDDDETDPAAEQDDPGTENAGVDNDDNDDDPDPSDTTTTDDNGQGTGNGNDDLNSSARTADWDETFLFRVPEFQKGRYTGYTPEDTFDIAHFSGVSSTDVLQYIKEAQNAGFINDVQIQERESRIDYRAADEDRWIIDLKYSDGELSIASGYVEEKVENENKAADIWAKTLLAKLPMFTAGDFTEGRKDGEGASYCAIFDNAPAETVRAYISEVRSAGFDIDPDEGDSDGIIWYSAQNADGITCSIIYHDGAVKVSALE